MLKLISNQIYASFLTDIVVIFAILRYKIPVSNAKSTPFVSIRVPSTWTCIAPPTNNFASAFNQALVFAPDNNPDHGKFQIFSRFIGVDWSLICENRFHH